ncbi:MAG: hypothetical protein P8X74_06945 [Reinekea sp.]
MKRIFISTVIASCISITQAVEWDAKQWFVGGGFGYAIPTAEDFEAAPLLSFNTGFNVPVLVEGHLRTSPLVQINYIPAVPEETEGQYGGNFFSASAALFVEHDLSIGGQTWWWGVAPQVSASFVLGQYQWQKFDAGLQAKEVDGEFAISAELVGRLTIPVLPSLEASLVGQVSPMSGSFHSASINLSFGL